VALIAAWMIALTTLGSIFGFTPLPLAFVLAIVAIVVVYLVVVEIVKYFFYRNLPTNTKIAVA
jgi:uncharacterized membrane protein YhdT